MVNVHMRYQQSTHSGEVKLNAMLAVVVRGGDVLALKQPAIDQQMRIRRGQISVATAGHPARCTVVQILREDRLYAIR